MKTKIYAIIILLFSVTDVQSQGDLINMKKYWFYRYRLLNDFMVKGDCQGCSEALNERGFNTEPKGKWGDNTINLANYISILALEYELLSQQGQPTDSTLDELHYAFKAFNRLDGGAEASFLPFYRDRINTTTIGGGGNINGFFMRDDVHGNFLNDHPRLKTGKTSSRIIDTISSDFSDPLTEELNEMSHDQVWHLMMGFALVRKYVAGVSWKGTDFYSEAGYNVDRIINRIKENYWVIDNPNDGLPVERGPYVMELSYGAAEAACYVKNLNTSFNIGFPVHSCTEYHDAISYSTADLWMNFGRGYGTLITIYPEEDFKVQLLAALGNSWWNRSNPFLPDPYLVWTVIHDPSSFLHPFTSIATLVTATVPVPPTNVTVNELFTRAQIKDYQHLPLLRQVLHGGPNLIPTSYYDNLLDLGPCDGPHYFPGDMSTFEWSSSNRLHHPNHRGGLSNPGEYNGLDYMLYYNLYHVVVGNTVPNINFMDRVITYPFPTTGPIVVGTSTTPVVVEAFNTIRSSNTIDFNADVAYRAGTSIHFEPGFSVNSGANFHAYIDPFHCAAGDYRSMSNLNDTSNQAPTENLVAYTGPTTFVSYPKRIQTNENAVNETANINRPINISQTNTPISNGSQLHLTSSNLTISPNPNNGTFQITLNENHSSSGVKEIKVLDMMGNVFWSTGPSAENTFTADISSCSSGLYYVRCVNALNEIEIKKLIKK